MSTSESKPYYFTGTELILTRCAAHEVANDVQWNQLYVLTGIYWVDEYIVDPMGDILFVHDMRDRIWAIDLVTSSDGIAAVVERTD